MAEIGANSSCTSEAQTTPTRGSLNPHSLAAPKLSFGSTSSVAVSVHPLSSAVVDNRAPLLVPERGTLTTAQLIVQEKEWAGDTDSSSSSDVPARRSRRVTTPNTEAVRTPVEVEMARPEAAMVDIVCQSADHWGQFDSSSSSSDSGVDADRLRNKREERYNNLRKSDFAPSAEPEPKPVAVAPEQPRMPETERPQSTSHQINMKTKRDHIRFLITTITHFVDFVLRVWCLVLYYNNQCYPEVACLGFIQVVGIGLSTYITFHDADVLMLMEAATERHLVLRRLTEIFACIMCAPCQGIHVKRGLARQFHKSEVCTDFDEEEGRSSAPLPFGVPERTLPAALLMGVPFLLVNTVELVTRPAWILLSYHEAVFLWSSVVSLVTVSLGIIEIDVAVSSYVVTRYHMDWRRSGTRAGRLQWLYPIAHMSFRASEVFVRVNIISSLFAFCTTYQQFAVLMVLLDYACGVAALQLHSPDEERFMVHCFVAVGLLVADLSYFVDQPNFAISARRISRNLLCCRCVTWAIALFLAFFAKFSVAKSTSENLATDGAYDSASLVTATLVYLLLRYSPAIRKIGHDLHTAAERGDADRLQKLLEPHSGGQILDVNAITKDGLGLTPLMLASRGGHVEAARMLLQNGANHTLKTKGDGNTALHMAASNGHIAVCRVLMSAGADHNAYNGARKIPRDLAFKNRHKDWDLTTLLSKPQGDGRYHRQMKSIALVAMPAQVVDPYDLKNFFPSVSLDETPPPRALISVSSLIIARSAGLLARRILTRHEDRGALVQLNSLRRVKQLGQGGFGRVIEVELPYEAGGYTNWYQWQAKPQKRHYALKLQDKTSTKQQAYSEAIALQHIHHPFVVRLERAFHTPKFFALLLEFCPTDLNRILCKENSDGFCLGVETKAAATYMGQILLAITFLHKKKIIYRDVKPENILISESDEAKLTDFGLAREVGPSDRMSVAGTAGFLAPELTSVVTSFYSNNDSLLTSLVENESKYGDPYKCDAYSFGVTLQVTLLGTDGARKKEIKKKGPMLLPLLVNEEESNQLLADLLNAGRLSPAAHDLLVRRLLPYDPHERSRLSAPEVMDHRFFLESLECSNLANHLMPES